jgi:hypothetical protein
MSLTDRQRTKEIKRFPKWKELLEAKAEYKDKMIANVKRKQAREVKTNP